MWRLVLRRLAMMPLLLLGVVTIAFLLSHLTQANPLSAILSARQLDNPEVVAAAKARWGLDKPPIAQYGLYVAHVLQGDLGVSFRSNRPVLRDIADRLPATLELVIAAMIIGTVGGIGLGVIAAATRDRLPDHLARAFSLIGSSIPVFWSGLLLLYVFSVLLGWLPGPGRLSSRAVPPPWVTGFLTVDAVLAGRWDSFWDALSHLVLPSVALAWSTTGIVSRLVRGSMLEVLGQDYILMARAKGASEARVLVNHALRNALLPTLTVTGFTFAYLITGAVLVETIFAWPGIGSYAVDSVRVLDYPGIMGVTIVGGAGFLLATLVTDISYIFADPKLRQHS
jgi:ABC-type dipeptide/oligopeptide/nickel transport system permease component